MKAAPIDTVSEDLVTNLCCKHCGKELNTISKSDFCCKGCETVFQILQSAGLSQFYELKEKGVCFTPADPVQVKNQGNFEHWNTSSDLTVQLYIEGVHCSACLWLLEKIPSVLFDTVDSCNLDLGKSILHLQLKPGAKLSLVAELITLWGYTPHLIRDHQQVNQLTKLENRRRLVDLGVAGAIAGNVMLMSIPLYSGVTGSFQTLFEWISGLLSIPALFYSGRSLFKNVWSGFSNKTFPIDAPILLALFIAFSYSFYSLITGTHTLYFDSLTALIFLLLASRYYLSRLRQSAEMSLGTLDFFQINDHSTPGDIFSVTENQDLRFDGVLREGEIWVDLSKFSGESEAVYLKPGDLVYAGTKVMHIQGHNSVEVLFTGENTRLSKLLKKIEESQRTRSKVEIMSDRLAKYLLMIVSTIGVISLFVFLYAGMGAEAFSRVLALLIVTCPCALALATPLVFSLAMKSLMNKGVLVKDPNSLDQASQLSHIYFDKTGTLTDGRLSVLGGFASMDDQAISVLYSMVIRSHHPVSRAIYASLVNNKVATQLIQWEIFEEKSGIGLFANNDHHSYALVRSEQSTSGNTEVSLLQDGNWEITRINLIDKPRLDSKLIIQQLKKDHYQISILSGDHLACVRKLGHFLGIDDVRAELTPEEKSIFVQNGMMVGDGINDALALSKAKVSFAVQGGMEAAIKSSQVYSLKPGISGITDFLSTSKKVRSTLIVTFTLSTSYNIIGAVLSLSGHMNPLTAAVLMPLSALSVFSYSLWRFKKS